MENNSIHLLEKERIFVKIRMMKRKNNNTGIHMAKKVNQITTN